MLAAHEPQQLHIKTQGLQITISFRDNAKALFYELMAETTYFEEDMAKQTRKKHMQVGYPKEE